MLEDNMSEFDPGTNERTVTVTILMRSSDRLTTIKRFYANPEAKLPGAEILDVDVQAARPGAGARRFDSKTGKMIF